MLSARTTTTTLTKYRRELLYNIQHNSIVILVVEGDECSKYVATDVPMYVLESTSNNTSGCNTSVIGTNHNNNSNNNNILITQSDTTNAIQCAQYVQNYYHSLEEENNNSNGRTVINDISVGYTKPIIELSTTINNTNQFNNSNHEQYNNNSNSNNRIQYMTHDILIHEIMNVDPLLINYSTIMVLCSNNNSSGDTTEVRSIYVDIIFGLLYKIRQQRRIHIIIVLSTINTTSHIHSIQSILQYFIGIQNAQRIIDTTTTTTSTSSANSNHVTTTISVPIHILSDIQSWNQMGTILSINDHPNCPVDIYYLSKPSSDYIVSIIETIWYIVISNTNHQHQHHNSGDILCFVPSYYDIQKAIHYAEEYFDQQKQQHNSKNNRTIYDIDFIPYTPSLSLPPISDDNHIRYQRHQRRRRVIFTNIDSGVSSSSSSASTIPNIQYVIDSGYTKLSVLDYKNTGLDRIYTTSISQVHATSRTSYASHYHPNRIGGLSSSSSSSSFAIGHCYRLYTETFYNEQMKLSTSPEISRSSHISYVILLFKYLGIDNILTFDFITVPDIEVIQYGLETLYVLGAIDETTTLTSMGYNMAQFPIYIEPKMSRMLLESVQYHCTWEVITIASVMICIQQQEQHASTQRIIQTKPKQNQQLLMDYNDSMSNIADPTGDHVTYWNIFQQVDQHLYNIDYDYCREHFLQYNTVRQCMHIRKRLARFIKRFSNKISTYQNAENVSIGTSKSTQYDQSQVLRRCITVGYFMNVAKLGSDGQYYMIRNNNIMVVPSTRYSFYSTHTKMSSEYILFCYPMTNYDHDNNNNNDTTITDTCIEVQHVSSIDAKWLREIAPHYFE